MAKISLRSYLKEIDTLIDRGENSEAIAHCKYLLKIFPKYIPVYTLLGKAYLESQKYSEALDIFQRVLSVYPDDFIAHLSLSIIREGEDNLDAAIFHMERAYEVHPANPGIQNELRRLYGRRDGAIPPRVRLTRGALVRMYERGELYRQAIAEIRAAITENQDRIDLKVILCRMYYLSGQKVEAADIAGQLLSRLPFCFEANRILADILPGTSRAEDAELYKKHVLDLDPYYGFTSLSSPNTAHVSDSSIQVDQLDVRSAGPFTDTGWAQNLGISLPGPSQGEELPDWFHNSQTPQVEQISEPVQELPSGNDEIPDFIRQAGFSAATSPEQPTALDLPEEKSDEDGELAAADIPDWLQSIAPVEGTTDSSISNEDETWFQGLVQPDTESPSASEHQSLPETPDETLVSPEQISQGDELPDWLKAEETEPQTEGEQPVTELPVWLNQPPVMPDRNELPESDQPSTSIPDWLEGISDDLPAPQAESETEHDSTIEEEPEWIQELSTSASASEQLLPSENLPPAEVTEEIPDWLSGIIPQTSDQQTEQPLEIPTTSSVKDEESQPVDIPLVLEEKSGIPSADSEVLSHEHDLGESQTEQPIEIEIDQMNANLNSEGSSQAVEGEPPEWLIDNQQGTPEKEIEIETSDTIVFGEGESGQFAEAAYSTELPAWLEEAQSIVSPVASAEDEKETPQVSENLEEPSPEIPLPDWLSGLDQEPALTEESREISEPITESIPPESEKSSEIEPALEISGEQVPAQVPDTFAVEKETIPFTSEIPEDLGVDLLSKEQEESQAPTQPVQIPHKPSEPFVTAESSIPSVESPSETEEMPVDNTTLNFDENKIESEVYDHSINIEAPPPSDTMVEVEEEVNQVDEISIRSTEPTIIGQLPADELSEPSLPQTDEMPADLDAALAWMEALAARQGAVEGTLSTEAEAQSTEMPDWLKREVENAPEAPPLPLSEEGENSQQQDGLFQPELESSSKEEISPAQMIEDTSSETIEEAHPDLMEINPMPETQEASSLQSPTETNLPDWLQDLEEEVPSSGIEGTTETLSEEWIREETTQTEESPFAELPDQETNELPVPDLTSAVDIQQEMEQNPADELPKETIIPTTPVEKVGEQTSPEDILKQAQAALKQNDLQSAQESYEDLIHHGKLLEETIHDLREVIDRHPMETPFYQLLGDAYMQSNQLQEALDAYTKAEQLLR